VLHYTKSTALTPNLLLRGNPAPYLEENRDEANGREEMTRWLRYLKTCPDNVRKRWLNEYLHVLQENFNSQPEARRYDLSEKALTGTNKGHDEEQSKLESWPYN